jgi:hypothetical protein
MECVLDVVGIVLNAGLDGVAELWGPFLTFKLLSYEGERTAPEELDFKNVLWHGAHMGIAVTESVWRDRLLAKDRAQTEQVSLDSDEICIGRLSAPLQKELLRDIRVINYSPHVACVSEMALGNYGAVEQW